MPVPRERDDPGDRPESYAVPSSVSRIGESAFSGCTLTNVTIDSTADIDSYSFAFCSDLTSVTLGDGVLIIGEEAFKGCGALTSMTIPDSVMNLQSRAFAYCGGLTNVMIGSGVGYIGGSAFSSCYALTDVTLGNGVTTIGTNVFQNCVALTSLLIPDGVSNIGEFALDGSGLMSVTLPSSMTSVGPFTFYNCPSLQSVAIPNSVTSISTGAFMFCSALTSVTIPDSVTSIETYAFAYCASLGNVYCQGNAPVPGASALAGSDSAVIYYRPDTTGWGASYGDRPTVAWAPSILGDDASFGLQTNGFGFRIAESESGLVVVKACANLAEGSWVPLNTNSMSSSTATFNDPDWIHHPNRFYRLSMP